MLHIQVLLSLYSLPPRLCCWKNASVVNAVTDIAHKKGPRLGKVLRTPPLQDRAITQGVPILYRESRSSEPDLMQHHTCTWCRGGRNEEEHQDRWGLEIFRDVILKEHGRGHLDHVRASEQDSVGGFV